MKNNLSPEAAEQALKIAKGTQKSGQTKEQTKLIKQGIEKGIAEYKKQQNKKLREIDKQRKQKNKEQASANLAPAVEKNDHLSKPALPWVLLAISWLGFAVYMAL